MTASRCADGTYLSQPDGATMVLVPEGWFTMGLPDEDILAADAAKPARRVWLETFLVDRDPVTNERFARFVEAGGYRERAYWSKTGWAFRTACDLRSPTSFEVSGFDAPEQPACGLSWFEAAAYARWAGKALPTEAQWEKAARGPDGRRFPWGDGLPLSTLCNFNQNVGRTTAPGTYPGGVSPYGVHDLAGNVNNWCRDWYWVGFYRHCAARGLDRNPVLSDAERERVPRGLPGLRADRGGGFATDFACWEVLSGAGRLAWPPETRRLWHGLRCVSEAVGPR